VLEVNPRASRTVPFVSKAIGVPLAKLAAKVMAGKTLKELNFTEEIWPKYWAVKESVFPFNRFRPGHFALAGNALHRRSHGPGRRPRRGLREIADGRELAAAAGRKVFISVSDAHKKEVAAVAKQFSDLGFELVATSGTANGPGKGRIESPAHPQIARRPSQRD
jgi:carbamoyl-phosphate synthase large subunit